MNEPFPNEAFTVYAIGKIVGTSRRVEAENNNKNGRREERGSGGRGIVKRHIIIFQFSVEMKANDVNTMCVRMCVQCVLWWGVRDEIETFFLFSTGSTKCLMHFAMCEWT